MPVLRSQRSKPSKRRVEEEMAPPEDVSPPKTRTTRSKKVSRKEEVDTAEVPKSPIPSSSSTRSTRTRTRSKVPPVEEVEVASPPKARATRSTRQKTVTTASKASKSSAKIEKESVVEDTTSASDAAVVAPTPSTSSTKSKAKKTTAKKAKAKPKKVKKVVEPASEDVTEEESDMEPKEKKLSLKQLHKNYVAPLKTVMEGAVCEVFPQVRKTIMDETGAKEQEKKFQELLSCTSIEMPPPAAPAAKKPKGKGRQKRARSPEKTPVKTKVPESFNFAVSGAEDHVPATKKIIMDAPTPETDENIFEQSAMEVDEDTSTNDEAVKGANADTTHGKEVSQDIQMKEEVDTRSNHEESKTKPVSKQDLEPKIKPLKKQDEDTMTKLLDKKDEKSKPLKKQDEETMTKLLDKKDEKSKPLKKQEEEPKTKLLKEQEEEPKTKPLKKQEEELKSKPLKKQEEEPKSKPLKKQEEEPKSKPLKKQEEEPKSKPLKKQEEEPKSKPLKKQEEEPKTKSHSEHDNDETEVKSLVGQDAIKTATVEPEKKSGALDETYVFETPKDDKKEKDIKLNSTFTPELFVDTTPKSRPVAADTTIVISKPTENDIKEVVVLEDSVLAPPSPEVENSSDAASSANGLVSSLVSFFDKTKKELGSKISKTPSKTDNVELDKNTGVPAKNDSVEKVCADNNDLNSTYVLPATKKTNPSSMMNVTVCVKKASTPEDEGDKKFGLKPIVPPASLLMQSNNSRFMHDSPASRTFVKEPPSLAVVMEEDDEKKDASKATKPSEKTKPVPVANSKTTQKEKEPSTKKGFSSSSSSSSCSSMKSASSQPCLLSASKKPPTGLVKNGPNYGSAGKLNEVVKSKTLEDAEKRRQELLQQKVELSKKKREEWVKKTEKNKLEEEKRLKEKQKLIQPISSSSAMKKPTPLVTKPEGGVGATGFPKPKYNFGPSTSKMPNHNLPLPLSKNPYHKPPSNDGDMDDSFKSAQNSFLDQTTEGHLSSYDITVYEDLDDDLKHRENKTLPTWASDKEALKTALFSMVLLPDYEHKLTGGFPKPDKTYKLFPTTRLGIGHQ